MAFDSRFTDYMVMYTIKLDILVAINFETRLITWKHDVLLGNIHD